MLALLAGAAVAGYQDWQARSNSAGQAYRVAKVERGSIQSVVAASGTRAAGTTVVIGVFFGSCPARKAARLDPVEALRFG